MAQPQSDHIALALGALAAAISIACAIRDTVPRAVAEPVAVAVPCADTLDTA